MRLIHGDCLDVLRTLPDCTVDAVVTDPPAGIAFMGKAWDGDKGGRDQWIAWLAERLAECLRVLKPGGHAVVWALPRTSGWTHRALEDAGFDVRDCVHHLFGSGFPKSLDVGKAIDKAAGTEREVLGVNGIRHNARGMWGAADPMSDNYDGSTFGVGPRFVTAPATAAAQQWDGWGTALKPAVEHWWLARKPLDSTVAGTVTRWGTGALNIAACRVPGAKQSSAGSLHTFHGGEDGYEKGTGRQYDNAGRWPADVVLSHTAECNGVCSPGCAVAELDRQSGTLPGSKPGTIYRTPRRPNDIYNGGGWHDGVENQKEFGYGDTGGASRFYATFRYQAKPSTREKSAGLAARNHHPTCKPVELLRWMCRLVTPPSGVILDPFAGSGTTGVAAVLEGFDCLLIEAEAEYLPLIEGRVRWAEQQAASVAPTLFGEMSCD